MWWFRNRYLYNWTNIKKVAHSNCSITIAPFSHEIIWTNWYEDKEILLNSIGKNQVVNLLVKPQTDGLHINKISKIIFNQTPINKQIRTGDAIASISYGQVRQEINNKKMYDDFIKQETAEKEQANSISINNNNNYNTPWKPGDH